MYQLNDFEKLGCKTGEVVTIADRDYLLVQKNNKTYFYRAFENGFKEIDEWDRILIADRYTITKKGTKKRFKKVRRFKGYSDSKPKRRPNFIKHVNFINIILYSNIVIGGFIWLQYRHQANSEIAYNFTLIQDINIGNEYLPEIKINCTKTSEAWPFFENFKLVVNELLSDFAISTEIEKPSIIIAPKLFAMDNAAAYYNHTYNFIHIRELNDLFHSIYHELFHWITSEYWINSSYGLSLYEAMTVLLDIEFFGHVTYIPMHLAELDLLRILIKIVGVENTIHPLLNLKSIYYTADAIDEVMQQDGFGELLLRSMDNFRLNHENDIENSYLQEVQFKLIDLYFTKLRNGIEENTLEESLNLAFRLNYLLITSENRDENFKEIHSNLSRVIEHYETIKSEFINEILVINPNLASEIEEIEARVHAEGKDYFINQRHIHHGKRGFKLYIHEALDIENTTTISIEKREIPIHQNFNEHKIVYHFAKVIKEEGTLNHQSQTYRIDDIRNHELFQKIVKANPISNGRIFLEMSRLGVISRSYQLNINDEQEPIVLPFPTAYYIIEKINLDNSKSVFIEKRHIVNETLREHDIIYHLSKVIEQGAETQIYQIDDIRNHQIYQQIIADNPGEIGIRIELWIDEFGIIQGANQQSADSLPSPVNLRTNPHFLIRHTSNPNRTYTLIINRTHRQSINYNCNLNVTIIHTMVSITFDNRYINENISREALVYSELDPFFQNLIEQFYNKDNIHAVLNEFGEIISIRTSMLGQDWEEQ